MRDCCVARCFVKRTNRIVTVLNAILQFEDRHQKRRKDLLCGQELVDCVTDQVTPTDGRFGNLSVTRIDIKGSNFDEVVCIPTVLDVVIETNFL